MSALRWERPVDEREGVARLTRVAPPSADAGLGAGLMPPPRAGQEPATRRRSQGPPAAHRRPQSPPAPPPSAVFGPTGVARLTPRSAAAEARARELRQVMGRFATGVTVVTTTHRDTIHGMTANAFLSVSLRPPLVLVSLGRCRMSELLPRSGRYGVSVLACDQERFAAHFSGQRVSEVPPTFVWQGELPLLEGALAHIGCRVVDVHPAGDHVLWIGEVEHLSHRDGEPLLFYRGRFGTLAEVSDREARRS
ncbi:MAG TPA: flavin reductase family protein [Solirubrobacteraceae bacterium]|nr:flavin reductase family protein [Solirubrobacteraceae bacterium]